MKLEWLVGLQCVHQVYKQGDTWGRYTDEAGCVGGDEAECGSEEMGNKNLQIN